MQATQSQRPASDSQGQNFISVSGARRPDVFSPFMNKGYEASPGMSSGIAFPIANDLVIAWGVRRDWVSVFQRGWARRQACSTAVQPTPRSGAIRPSRIVRTPAAGQTRMRSSGPVQFPVDIVPSKGAAGALANHRQLRM